MEKIFSDQDYILKQPNDGRIQLRQLTLLKDLLNYVESIDKKTTTQIQSKIEELLFNLILNNRITSDILSRYISYIYIHIFDKGRNTHLTDLINSFIDILEHKDNNDKNISDNIKCTFMWIIGYICKKCEYKSPSMGSLMEVLINICSNKINSDLFMNESVRLIGKFLNMNINNTFGNKVPEVYKLISKKEKNISNKKYILKCIFGSLLYYENKELVTTNFYHKKYNFLMELFENYFKIKDESINKVAMKSFIYLHDNIIFKEESIQEYIDFDTSSTEKKINKNKKLILKSNELLNFLHVIHYFSQIDLLKYSTNKTYENSVRMLTHLNIIIYYIEKNKELLNINENIIDDIYELLLNSYNLSISLTSLTFFDGLNIVNNTNYLSMKSVEYEEEHNNIRKIEDEVNQKLILLFRIFIKSIYITSHRMHFLTELFSKLKEVQTYIDKLTEDSTVTISDLTVLIENGIISKVYSIPQINVLLLSLVEIGDNNPELFELNYNSFQDISNNISFFLTSGIRSFRILVTKFVCSLSYYLPSYRLSITALILNLIGVLYAEIVQLKNSMLYFNNMRSQEYKNSLIIHKNLILFKDICNCLSMVLSTSKHKSKGISIDSANDSFKKAKRIILGNQLASIEVNELKAPLIYCQSLLDESTNYLNKYLIAFKESGWIIIQGLCSMDKKFILQEYKNILFLFKYTFNEKTCKLNVEDLTKVEYQDNLISEFFIKREALYCLNKIIMLFKKDKQYMDLFKEHFIEILQYTIDFFIPQEKNDFINFYKYHLKEAYKDVQKVIYEIFYNLPIDFYIDKFNVLLYSLSDNITSQNYSYRNLYKNTLDLLNKIDTFMCMDDLNIDNSSYPNQYFIDNYYLPLMSKNMDNKECDLYQNYFISKNFNFIYISMSLLIKIFVHEKLNLKNKNAVIKFFLNCITEIVVKGINFRAIYEKTKDYKEQMGNYNKLTNIVICVYLFLRHSIKHKINLMEDLELFTNIKMIFDLCYKIEDFGILSIIACEGISYLINLYNKKDETLEHYLSLGEIKFNREKNMPKLNDFIYSFYLLGNIFRNIDYEYIKPFIDKYMNFIISCFNPNDIIATNPYIGQSLFSLCDSLIELKEFDKVKKILEIFKMNIIYINSSNKHFIKERFLYENIHEIKLLILFIRKYENLLEDEKQLIKSILFKYIKDHLYKNKALIRHFLLLVNEIINHNYISEFSEYIFDADLLQFLFEHKNNYTNNLLSLSIINYLLENCYKEIESVSKKINQKEKNNVNYIKNKISFYIRKVNELYHTNKNFFYINKIYKTFYDNDEINNDINHILDFNNIFDKMFNNYHLIMIYKAIIKNYIFKNYTNIDESINFLKIILQKKINLYKNDSGATQKDKSSEGGDESLKDNQDNLSANNMKLLFDINNLNYILHINLQKFLIKQITKSLIKYVDDILKTKTNSSNRTMIEKVKIDLLGKLMSISMILIQCEESWEIKYLGIKLLHKLLIKFSNIKDSRSDDDSLLIQQYEVQISSCIKNIFISKSKSPVTFKSISKGFNLIYLFLTISISNDTEFIKKFNEYIHFLDFLNENKNKLIKIGNSNFNFCSEKEENIVNCRYFALLCKLFISSFTKKYFSIKYIHDRKEEKIIEFYSTNMAEEIKNDLKDKFIANIKNFCISLKNMMYKMFTNYFKKSIDDKVINVDLNSSNKIWLKYSSLFLTTISILLHNNELKNYEEVFDEEYIQFLCNLIFFLIKKINTHKNCKDAIFYIIDIFSALINNKIFKLNYDAYSLCINKFEDLIKINDFKDNKNFILLFQKFNDNLLNDNNGLSDENNIDLIKRESQLIKSIKDNYSQNYNSVFVIIYNNIILKIIKLYNKDIDNDNNTFEQEFKYYINLLFVIYSNNNDNNVCKLLLEKLFTILLNINNDKKELFKLYIEELIITLVKLNNNFQKYFTLFYIIIQYISKSSNSELTQEIKTKYIEATLNITNKLYDTTNKSMLLSISQMNNSNMINFIGQYLEALFSKSENNNNTNKFGQEIQKLILLYIQNEKNDNLRQNIIKHVIKYLNDNKDIMSIKDTCTFVLGITKINNLDNNLINEEEVKKTFNEEFNKQINEILNVNKNNEVEQKKEEQDNKKDENQDEVDDDEFDEVEG